MAIEKFDLEPDHKPDVAAEREVRQAYILFSRETIARVLSEDMPEGYHVIADEGAENANTYDHRVAEKLGHLAAELSMTDREFRYKFMNLLFKRLKDAGSLEALLDNPDLL